MHTDAINSPKTEYTFRDNSKLSSGPRPKGPSNKNFNTTKLGEIKINNCFTDRG